MLCLEILDRYSSVVGSANLEEIYAFNHADKRFLTMAKTAFPSTRKWTSIEHRTSYRATNELVKFYNNQLLNPSDTPINAVKAGERPRYLICNSYSDTPLEELLRYLSVVDQSQVLVLAPSIRSMRSPVRDLANKIALEYPSISCYIPTSDEETLSPTLLDGKLLFCTYHQAKGIEREAVLMFCFDTSFYKLYNRAGNKSTISNAQYVGATRSSRYLTVIHDTSYDYLPFLNKDTLSEHCDMFVEREPLPDAIEDPEEKKKSTGYAVTDLTRHVPEAVTSFCFEGFFRPELERPPAKYRVYPPTTIWLENGLLETVADITGSAIPAIYEFRSRGTCTLLENVQDELRSLAANENSVITAGEEHPFQHLPVSLRDKLLGLTPDMMDLSDFLLVANASNTSLSGYIHKLLQIKEYNWLEEKHIKPAMSVLQKHISSNARYERNVRGRANGIDIKGRVDVIDGNTLWELKWTDSLRPEHVLQLVSYAALDSIKHPNRVYKLLHVPTRQIVVVKGKAAGFMRVLEELVKVRMEGNRSLGLTDEAFEIELDREFEGFVGGLSIPTWLNTQIAQSK